MSILIKEIPMQESCSHCFVYPGFCPAIRKRLGSKLAPYTWIPANYRHEDCPLVEVPEYHGRLIDADAAAATIQPPSSTDEENACTFATVKALMHHLLNNAPTVIDAEEGE